MVSRDGYAKILDFGLAKLVAAARSARSPPTATQKTLIRVETQSGTIMGTVNYMSPEQLLGQRVDLRCDIFSFGVVLCEMLTGTCPFVDENQIDTMHAILHEEPRLRDAIKIQTAARPSTHPRQGSGQSAEAALSNDQRARRRNSRPSSAISSWGRPRRPRRKPGWS